MVLLNLVIANIGRTGISNHCSGSSLSNCSICNGITVYVGAEIVVVVVVIEVLALVALAEAEV